MARHVYVDTTWISLRPIADGVSLDLGKHGELTFRFEEHQLAINEDSSKEYCFFEGMAELDDRGLEAVCNALVDGTPGGITLLRGKQRVSNTVEGVKVARGYWKERGWIKLLRLRVEKRISVEQYTEGCAILGRFHDNPDTLSDTQARRRPVYTDLVTGKLEPEKLTEALALADVASGSTDAMTGTVRYHDAGVAIGGEADPSGYILSGSSVTGRLYLRFDDALDHAHLKQYEGKEISVMGDMAVIHAGGVETPRRTFSVLDVKEIRLAR